MSKQIQSCAMKMLNDDTKIRRSCLCVETSEDGDTSRDAGAGSRKTVPKNDYEEIESKARVSRGARYDVNSSSKARVSRGARYDVNSSSKARVSRGARYDVNSSPEARVSRGARCDVDPSRMDAPKRVTKIREMKSENENDTDNEKGELIFNKFMDVKMMNELKDAKDCTRDRTSDTRDADLIFGKRNMRECDKNTNDANNGDMKRGRRTSSHNVNGYERDEFEEGLSLNEDTAAKGTADNEGNVITEDEKQKLEERKNASLEADFEAESFDDHELNEGCTEEVEEEIDKEEVAEENEANGEVNYDKIMSREETLSTDFEDVKEDKEDSSEEYTSSRISILATNDVAGRKEECGTKKQERETRKEERGTKKTEDKTKIEEKTRVADDKRNKGNTHPKQTEAMFVKLTASHPNGATSFIPRKPRSRFKDQDMMQGGYDNAIKEDMIKIRADTKLLLKQQRRKPSDVKSLRRIWKKGLSFESNARKDEEIRH